MTVHGHGNALRRRSLKMLVKVALIVSVRMNVPATKETPRMTAIGGEREPELVAQQAAQADADHATVAPGLGQSPR
jgi:hypothetical protein